MDPRRTSAESMSVDDFASGFIAETEASMRGKLSELRLPTLDDTSSTSKGPMNPGQSEMNRQRFLVHQPVRPILQPMIASHRHILSPTNQTRVQYAVPGLTPVRVNVASSTQLSQVRPAPMRVNVASSMPLSQVRPAPVRVNVPSSTPLSQVRPAPVRVNVASSVPLSQVRPAPVRVNVATTSPLSQVRPAPMRVNVPSSTSLSQVSPAPVRLNVPSSTQLSQVRPAPIRVNVPSSMPLSQVRPPPMRVNVATTSPLSQVRPAPMRVNVPSNMPLSQVSPAPMRVNVPSSMPLTQVRPAPVRVNVASSVPLSQVRPAPMRVNVATTSPLSQIKPPIPNNVTVRELIFSAANKTVTTTSPNPMIYRGVSSVPSDSASFVPFTNKSGVPVFVRPSESSTPMAPIITITKPGTTASTSAPSISTHPPVIAIPPRAPPYRVNLSGTVPVRGFARDCVPVRPVQLVNTVFNNRVVNLGPPHAGYPLVANSVAKPMIVSPTRLPSTPTITNVDQTANKEKQDTPENAEQTDSTSLKISSTSSVQSDNDKSDIAKAGLDVNVAKGSVSDLSTTEENSKTPDKDAANIEKDQEGDTICVKDIHIEPQECEGNCNMEKESDSKLTDGMEETNKTLSSETSNTNAAIDDMTESEKGGKNDAPLDCVSADNSKEDIEVATENEDVVSSDNVVENKDNNDSNATAGETDELSEMSLPEKEKSNEVSVGDGVAISVIENKDIDKHADNNSQSLVASVDVFTEKEMIIDSNLTSNKDGESDNVTIDESMRKDRFTIVGGKENRAGTDEDAEGSENNKESQELDNAGFEVVMENVEGTMDQNASDMVSVDENTDDVAMPKENIDIPSSDAENMLIRTLPIEDSTNVIDSCKPGLSEIIEVDKKTSESIIDSRLMNIVESKDTSESDPLINTSEIMKRQYISGLEKQKETSESEERMDVEECKKQINTSDFEKQMDSLDSENQMETEEIDAQMEAHESEPMEVTLESEKQADVTETTKVDASESQIQMTALDIERPIETPNSGKQANVSESEKLDVSTKSTSETGTFEPEKIDHALEPKRTENTLDEENTDITLESDKTDSALEQEKTLEQDKTDKTLEREKKDNASEVEKIDVTFGQKNKEYPLREENTDNILESEKPDNASKSEKTDKIVEPEKPENALELEKIDNVLESEKIDNVLESEKIDNALEAEKIDNVLELEKIDNALEAEKTNVSLELGETDNTSKPEETDVALEQEKTETTLEPKMIENIFEPGTQTDGTETVTDSPELNKDENTQDSEMRVETPDADLYYEITENKDSEDEENSTNLLISNVVSLSESLPEDNSSNDSMIVEKEADQVDNIPETVKTLRTDQEKVNSTDVNNSHSQTPGPSNLETGVGDNAVAQKRKRKRKRESTAVRKAMDCIEQNTLEGMFIPVTTVLKSKDTLPGRNPVKETPKSKQSTGSLPVISNVFTMAATKASNLKTVPIAPIKREAVDTGEYNVAISKVSKSAPLSSATTIRPVHIGKKVTAPVNVTSPQTMLMSRVGSISGPQFQVMRYALQPSSIALSKVPVVPIAPSTSTISSQKHQSSQITVNDPYSKYDTINMTSVGVNLITDLIARKNPIPTYKAAAVSEKNKDEKSSLFPCYECGDTFYLRKSLDIHLSRRSMKIAYKCRNCNSELNFTNKCQLLNHLRSHMNILITQAVPIHIRSDSIEITSYYEELNNTNGKFEWYKYDERENLSQCPICKEYFNPKDFKNHLSGFQKNESLITCNSCWVEVRSKCAFQAHRKIHKVIELFQAKKLLNKGPSILEELICPNCGITPEAGASLWITINTFMHHLLYKCHHFSMNSTLSCVKCGEKETSHSSMMLHLIKKLEHYYKCDQCPMALKSLTNLEGHCQSKHSKQNQVLAKVIYRCHVCSTIIDDRKYLLLHLESHLATFVKKRSPVVHCLVCGLIVSSQQKLEDHSKQHRFVESVKDLDVFRECVFCRKKIQSPIRLVAHLMEAHISMQDNICSAVQECVTKVVFCDFCGLLCADNQAYVNHFCLGQLKKWQVVGNDVEEDKQCPICKVQFKNSYHKTVHMNSHLKNSEGVCLHCGQTDFEDENAFKSHKILCSAMKGKNLMRQTVVAKNEEIDVGNKQTGQNNKEKESKTGRRSSGDSKTGKSTEEDCKTGKWIDEDTESEIKLAPPKNRSKPVTPTMTYMCDKCTETFTRKSRLDAHVNSEHGLHPCHLCGEIHSSSSSLKRHLLIEHEGKRMVFVCPICRSRKIEKSFAMAPKLAKHMRIKHRVKNLDESQFITELPGFPGLVNKELSPEAQRSPETSIEPVVKKVKTENDPTTAFKCAKCLFTCEDKAEFCGHILEHKTPNSFQCPECGLCFSVFPSLKKHLFMVHKIRDFTRYIEENKIENPADSIDSDDDIEREPQRTEASDDSATEEDDHNPLECKVCYKRFDSENVLKCHMRVHGMAFIKRSRRRSKGLPPSKKAKLEHEEDRQCEMLDDGNNSLKLKIVKSVTSGDESLSSSPEKPSKMTEKASEMEVEENVDVKEVVEAASEQTDIDTQ